jgi:hypothetical protein
VGEHAVSGDDGEAIGSDPSLSPYRDHQVQLRILTTGTLVI